MAISKNIVIGISDLYGDPDTIIIRSTENKDNVNIISSSNQMGVKREDLVLALTEIKIFVDKRDPISVDNDLMIHSDI
jgi:hypothetical protein